MSRPQPKPESRWEPGAVVDGFNIIRRLARGGMAELFLATHEDTPDEQVVIKRVHAHLRSDPGFDAMFVRETRIAASLHHPNIVRVLGTGTVGDELYLVMELLQGLDVRALLRALSRRGTAVGYGDAIRIVIEAARGLAYAHDREDGDGQQLGIVHRDVSPSNLFVTETGEVKLVDFGIAKTTNATQITGVGVRKGKGAYMAPEQCMAGVVDRRTDVFALGAVLYELTTMTRAYDGDNELAVLHAITTRDVDPPSSRVPGYPAALEAVVTAALQRDADQRWSDAGEMAEALEELSRRPEFHSSAASLAGLVKGLTGDAADSGALMPPAVDLTPPPFGVGDRSDGALLLPTPTSMEAIVAEDSERVTVSDVVRSNQHTPGGHRGRPSAASKDNPAVVAGGTAVAAGTSLPGVTQVPTDASAQSRSNIVLEPAVPPIEAVVPATSQPLSTNASAVSAVAVAAVEPAPGGPSNTGWIAAALLVVLGGGVAAWLLTQPERAPSPTAAPATASASTTRPTPAPSAAAATPTEVTPTPPTAETTAVDPAERLARLNDPLRAGAMEFATRHAAIREVTAAGHAEELDIALQLYLDLTQARDADKPCATFRGALSSLTASGNDSLLAQAKASATAPTSPGADEAPDACEGLAAMLRDAGTRSATATAPTPAKPSRRTPKSTGKSKPRPAPKPVAEPPKSEPVPSKPRPSKPNVGGKIGDDLRPFGK